MFDELFEIIKNNPTRRFCLCGAVVVAVVEIAVRIIILLHGELIGSETIRVVLALASATLGLIALYPPQSMKKVRYWVFYISIGCLAIEYCLKTVLATYFRMALPGWVLILKAILFLIFFGSFLLDKSSPVTRKKATIIAIVLILSAVLVPILMHILF